MAASRAPAPGSIIGHCAHRIVRAICSPPQLFESIGANLQGDNFCIMKFRTTYNQMPHIHPPSELPPGPLPNNISPPHTALLMC